MLTTLNVNKDRPERVWMHVWDQARDRAWCTFRGIVKDYVADQIYSQVWYPVRDQVLGKIGDPVADQVWVRVWYPVKAQLKQDIEC